jgi:hypothetical protein
VLIKGIGEAPTIGLGLSENKGTNLAALSIGIAMTVISQMRREVADYGDKDDSSVSYQSNSSVPDADAKDSDSVLVKIRVSPDAVGRWWDCPMDFAQNNSKAAR